MKLKLIVRILIAGIAVQFCGCSTNQKFSNEYGHYTIIWSHDYIRKITCQSSKLPEGRITVKIHRDDRSQEVLINNEKNKIWSKDVFTRKAETGSCYGVISHTESHYIGTDRFEDKEWKLESNGIPIYKESEIKSQNGTFKKHEFFGPFGVELKSPKMNCTSQP